jgi:transcriptional regulator with XRE-family HTH domain
MSGFRTQSRYWRGVRRSSQLDLASAAMTTPRYVSFVETGRVAPSREMVLRLAAALDVPLRERNCLLLAAGFAPMYSAEPLEALQLRRHRRTRAPARGHVEECASHCLSPRPPCIGAPSGPVNRPCRECGEICGSKRIPSRCQEDFDRTVVH